MLQRVFFLRRACLLIFGLVFVIACDKDENTAVDLSGKTLSAKWNVAAGSDYKSFEFNEDGSYIVVKGASDILKSTSETVLFGSYEIVDNSTILLSDLGALKVVEIGKNSIELAISFDNNSTVHAARQKEAEMSRNTELLCRTWNVVSFGDTEGGDGLITLFSKAGTYFVKAGDANVGLGVWAWCNAAEDKLAFTIDDELNCEGKQVIKDIQLTTTSFVGTDLENEEPMELVMKPIN